MNPRHPDPERFLFVSGCPRSGTTVMATLLNWNDSVLVGQERFAVLLRFKPDEFGPDLFTPGRMLDFRKGDCGYAGFGGQKEYSSPYANPKDYSSPGDYPVRGDKITHLYKRLRMFEGAEWDGKEVMLVHMIRNPVDVACSYETRKLNQADRWQLGYDIAIEEWTQSVDTMHAYLQQPEPRVRVGLVSYDALFCDGEQETTRVLARVYAFAGLDFGGKQVEGIEKVHRAARAFRERRQRHQHVVDEVEQLLSPETMRKYEALLELAI